MFSIGRSDRSKTRLSSGKRKKRRSWEKASIPGLRVAKVQAELGKEAGFKGVGLGERVARSARAKNVGDSDANGGPHFYVMLNSQVRTSGRETYGKQSKGLGPPTIVVQHIASRPITGLEGCTLLSKHRPQHWGGGRLASRDLAVTVWSPTRHHASLESADHRTPGFCAALHAQQQTQAARLLRVDAPSLYIQIRTMTDRKTPPHMRDNPSDDEYDFADASASETETAHSGSTGSETVSKDGKVAGGTMGKGGDMGVKMLEKMLKRKAQVGEVEIDPQIGGHAGTSRWVAVDARLHGLHGRGPGAIIPCIHDR